MNRSIRINAFLLMQFLRRDIYVYSQQLIQYMINNVAIYPAMYAFSFAYLQVRAYFGQAGDAMSSYLFAGNIILPLMTTSFFVTFDLFFDLQKNKHVLYQTTILNPRLVLLERMLFSWLFCCMLTLPFYPVAKLLLGGTLDTSNTDWLMVFVIVVIGSLFCTSYHMLAATVLRCPDQINLLWVRVNLPLFLLGGFFIPRHIIHQFSPALGMLLYLNPATYITDGMRQAMVGGDRFLPIWLCVGVLIVGSVICTLLTWHYFKKRVDHI